MVNTFPKMAQILLESLAPGFLEPIPSVALLDLSQTPPGKTFVPEGSFWTPAGRDTAVCRFTTPWEERIEPLEIRSFEREDQARYRLSMHWLGSKRELLPAHPLRLWIHAQPESAAEWYRLLTQALTSLEFSLLHQRREVLSAIRAPRIAGRRFPDLGHQANPVPPMLMELRDSLNTPVEWFFVELPIPPISRGGEFDELRWTMQFKTPIPLEFEILENLLCLHVTPAINRYRLSAEPILYEGTQSGGPRAIPEDLSQSHPLILDRLHPERLIPLHIASVTGISVIDGHKTEYAPFQWDNMMPQYSFFVEEMPSGERRPCLSFKREPSDPETISCLVDVTDRDLPPLRPGCLMSLQTIDSAGRGTPPSAIEGVQGRLRTTPTARIEPPTDWAHWLFSLLRYPSPLTDEQALVALSKICTWTEVRRGPKILGLTVDPGFSIERGLTIPTWHISLTLDDDRGPGSRFCEAERLWSILRRAIPLNTRLHCTIGTAREPRAWEWT